MKYIYTNEQIKQALDEAIELGGYSVTLLSEDEYKVEHNNLLLIINDKKIVDNSIIVNKNELIELALKGLILYFKQLTENTNNSSDMTATKISHLNQIIDILSSQL